MDKMIDLIMNRNGCNHAQAAMIAEDLGKIDPRLQPLLDEGADRIVLGCTHYPFLLETLRKVAAQLGHPGVLFIDPAPAVARRLAEVLAERGIAPEDENPGTELLSSGPRENLLELYSSI